MRVVIAGASGFVGNGLARHLRENPAALGAPISKLILADLRREQAQQSFEDSDLVEWHCGDLTDPVYLDSLLKDPVDCFFHLASVPGSAAERNPDLGWSVNVTAPTMLAERLARQGRTGTQVPRIVFASSIAVYGPLGPAPVNEDTAPRPTISYGAHKLIMEILLADLSRRGEVDARCLRLPGIVARPLTESGHGSAFMSLLFHHAAAGKAYTCPVSREATAWWMSLASCVTNLAHAATLDARAAPLSRTWQLPALYSSVGEIVAALADRFGPESTSGFSFEPQELIETIFGRLPALSTPRANDAGFVSDNDPHTLVSNIFGP